MAKKGGCCSFIFITIVVIVGAVFGLLYFYLSGINHVSNFIVDHMSMDVDKEIGQQVRDQMLNEYKIKKAETENINAFFEELHFGPAPRIYVVEEKQFNAVSLPGSYMVVFSGALNEVNNSSELAGLLGHEYAHIKNRHGMRSLAQGMARQLLISLIFGGAETPAAQMAQNANQLVGLKYSRDFEHEADVQSLEMMRQSKIDPNGMVTLFKRLSEIEKAGGHTTTTILSDHPVTEDRIDYLNDSIALHIYKPIEHKRLDSLFKAIKAGDGDKGEKLDSTSKNKEDWN